MILGSMLLGFSACTQTVHFPESRYPTGDSGVWDSGHSGLVPPPAPGPSPAIERSTLDYGCNGAQTGFVASFRTGGWSGSATMLMVAPTRNERHPLDLEDTAIDGRWDRYALGPLLTGPTFVPGHRTTFTCSEAASITWVLWTTDQIGAPADCVHWGPDAAGAIAAVTTEAPDVAGLCVDLGPSP